MKSAICLILGGGRGTRLYPLTKYRAKPAVPLAGKYRLIDIPISNCLNSGFNRIAILTQFNSESLNRHITRGYKLDSISQGFVEIIAAEQSMDDTTWFQGSADAVRKCLKHIADPRIEYVIILSGDQLYKMNIRELVNFHIEKKSELTVACNVVGREDAPALGIMGIDASSRIVQFIEKPAQEDDISFLALPGENGGRYLASMGIYVFNKAALFDLLMHNTQADFGKEVIPEAIAKKKTYAYPYRGYWKDIGSIRSFYEENLAFAAPEPPLDLFDEEWPFYTRPRYLPLSRIADCTIRQSVIAEGATLDHATIVHSVIGLRSRIGAGSVIEDSILLGCDYFQTEEVSAEQGTGVPLGIGKKCHIRRAIIDKNVRIGDHVSILNRKNLQDFENEYCVIRSGIVVVPKNTVIPPGTII